MFFCYVDESGDTAVLSSPTCDLSPLLVVSGLILDQSALHDLTLEFLYLKREFFPGAKLSNGASPANFLDWMLYEVKGCDLRKLAAEPSKRRNRHAIRFLGKTLDLIENAGGKLVGRVWVKGIGAAVNGRSIQTSSIQHLCGYFDHFLQQQYDGGILIADSVTKDVNARVSHSIFTQRYSARGNLYANLLEAPVFGHSDNHAGLQLSDLVCSGILFPIAINNFCDGHVTNVHVRPGFRRIKEHFAQRLKSLQHRILSPAGKWSGGIVCSDEIARRPGGLLFDV